MAQTIKIKQIRSGIGRPPNQRQTLRGLGFKRLHQIVVREDTDCIRGMVNKIQHLVQIQD